MTDEQQKGNDSKPVDGVSKSKDDAEKSFLKKRDEAEKKVSAPAAKPASVPPEAPKDDKSKSKFAAAMESMKSKPGRKREIDPILGVSLVIFILASVVVLGNTVYANYISTDGGATVAYGDTVEVNYTGAFNNFYGENGAIVFDTNVEDVGNHLKDNSDQKSWGYTDKKTYSALSFTVGGTTVLKKFGSATVGGHVGDKVQVKVEKDEGYELPDTSKGKLETKAVDVSLITMTSSEFSALYGFSAPSSGSAPLHITYDEAHKLLCPFGCSYTVSTNTDGKVNITNELTNGSQYKMFGQDNAKITVSSSGGGLHIDYKDIVVPDTGKMTKLAVYHDGAWVLGYAYKDGNVNMYKTGETLGETLYFTIEITKITKA